MWIIEETIEYYGDNWIINVWKGKDDGQWEKGQTTCPWLDYLKLLTDKYLHGCGEIADGAGVPVYFD